ncbi:hypothetical protein PO909_028401 [Leuciscus waleckii]
MSLFLFLLLTCLRLQGVFAYTEEVSVMEGDSVTLNTGVQTNQQDLIRWYYNDILIALITGDLSYNCTDVQCDEDTERFRGRLKLDHQTGSLTIMNTRYTDSGEYTLEIISYSSDSVKIFIVSVTGESSCLQASVDKVSVVEGDPVTLNTDVQTNQQHRIRWYYNVILIAQIKRDQSNICTDVQCYEGNERFRDRLKLDHQTGSLTIMNTRDTDTGEYTLEINSISNSRFSEKIFSVSVYDPDPDPDPGRGIYAAVIVAVIVAVILQIVAVIYFCKRRARRNEANRTERDNQESRAEDSSPDQRETFLMKNLRDSNLNQTEAEAANETPT